MIFSFCCSSVCTVCHWASDSTCRRASARFWLIMTKVDRKIASSETIMVSNPNGYLSNPMRIPPIRIQSANQTMCT